MKTVTNGFKEQIAQLGREIDFKFFLHTNDKLITQDGKFLITHENQQLVVEQFDDIEVDETIEAEDIYNVSIITKGNILSTLMKEIDFEIAKDLRIGDVIDCEFGVKVGNNYEYVNYGSYMIYSKEYNEDTKTFSYVAYDRMLLTMQEASQTFLTSLENKTLAYCINTICNNVGLSFTATQEQLTKYPNLNKQINEGTFTDLQITYRDVLDMICQALGLSMIIEDKQLKLKSIPKNKENTITGGNSLYITDVKQSNAVLYTVDGVTEQDGTPTPSSPVDIKTIPSKINYFNNNVIRAQQANYNVITDESITTGKKLTYTGTTTTNATYLNYVIMDLTNYVGKTIRFKTDFTPSSSNTGRFVIGLCNADGSNRTSKSTQNTSGTTASFTVPTLSGQQTYLFVNLYVNTGSGTANANDYMKFTNMILTIDDTDMSYIPYGHYARVKVTGKNLFDYSKNILSGTNINENTMKLYSDSTCKLGYVKCKPNTTYTISRRTPMTNRFIVATTENVPAIGSDILSVVTVFNNTTTKHTITTPANAHYIVVRFINNVTSDDYETYAQTIQIEENSTVSDYEPYKEHNVLIDLSKENLFDKNNANTLNAYLTISNNNILASNADKCVWIRCNPNTTYNIQKMAQSTTSNNRFSIATTVEEPTVGVQKYNQANYGLTDTKNINYTTNATANYLVIFCYTNNNENTFQEILNSIVIYEGTNSTPYHELCKIGDYKDTLSINDSGQVVINKNIGKVILNGNENWAFVSNSNIPFRYNLPSNVVRTANVSTIPNIITNYYTTYSWNETLNNNYGVTLGVNENLIDFRNTDITTLANWKTWLASNNVSVYYVLATPQTITLSNTTLPLYEGINHITFVDDLETSTSLTYYLNDLAVDQIDETYLKDTNVSFGEKYMINSVVLSRSEDNDNIYRRDEESVAENGVHEFKIKDNLIMLYDDREDYIDEIFEQLNGLEYYINDFNSTGITYLDWLDFYNVTVGDKTYKCLMLNDEIKIQQGLEETVYTEEPEETVTPYKTSSKTDKEVSFIVDKQNGRIKAKVSQDDIIASLNVAIEDGQGVVELKGNSVIIDSDNLTADRYGNIECNNIKATNGEFTGNIKAGSQIYLTDNGELGTSNLIINYKNCNAIIKSNKIHIGNMGEEWTVRNNIHEFSYDNTNLDSSGNPNDSYFFVGKYDLQRGGGGGYFQTNKSGLTIHSDSTYNSSDFDFEDGKGGYIYVDNAVIGLSSQPVIGSDERLKQEIKDIDTSWIDELKVKEFEYIKSPERKQIGLIAQDYEDKEYAKYFLNQDKDGYYAITYGNITNALIQYCQEMKKEINSLKEEIAKLKESDK